MVGNIPLFHWSVELRRDFDRYTEIFLLYVLTTFADTGARSREGQCKRRSSCTRPPDRVSRGNLVPTDMHSMVCSIASFQREIIIVNNFESLIPKMFLVPRECG